MRSCLRHRGRNLYFARPFVLRTRSNFSLPSPKKLDEIVKLSLLREESRDRICEIWSSHAGEQSHVGNMSSEEYQRLSERARTCSLFVFPVFQEQTPSSSSSSRPDSYYSMLSQFQGSNFFMTFLDDYKKDPATAQPWISLALYPELVDDKDVCLYRADRLGNVGDSDAESLVALLLKAYCSTDDSLYKHISEFNLNLEKFDFVSSLEDCWKSLTK